MSNPTNLSDLLHSGGFTSSSHFSNDWTATQMSTTVAMGTTENNTIEIILPAQFPPHMKPEIVWTIMPIIIVSNTLVVSAFVLTRSLRVVANYFVVSLAASDLFTGIVLIPLVMSMNPAGGKLVTFSLLTTLFMICGCTYDRYIAVSYPLQYAEKVTKTRVLLILAASWVAPCIITIIPEIWNRQADFQKRLEHRVFIATNAFIIVIAIFFHASIYIHIFRIARRHVIAIRQLDRFQESTDPESRRKSAISLRGFVREIKFAKLFASVGVFYFIFWLPIGYINLVDDVFRRSDLMPNWIFTMSFYTMWLSSLVNPTLYALFTRSFRKVILQWFHHVPCGRWLQGRKGSGVSPVIRDSG